MARDYRPASSRLAIDANVLSLLVVYNLCVNARAVERGIILNEVRRGQDKSDLPPERFEDLWQVFSSGRVTRRIVTQHVVAETLSRLRGWLKVRSEAVRNSGISLVLAFGLEEQPCRIRDLAADEAYLKALIVLGPTDAGLLHVAESTRATLITDDGPLRGFAAGRGVEAYPVGDVHLLAQHP